MTSPLILRGTLITLRRKCGKPTCRCTRGALHETLALAYRVAGTTKMLTLRPQDVSEVRAALTRYKQVQRRLERQVQAQVATLRTRIAREKARARRARR